MNRVHALMHRYWGYDQFLPLQSEAMECVLTGRDSMVVLPTGGGKSLCFQAPALALEGTAIVVSPLISLMKDQVDGLRECGVAAACLHSGLEGNEAGQVLRAFHAGALKLLYVAPERLTMDSFVERLRQTPLSFIAVDEAHCISMWGHDFRPEYRALSLIRQELPNLPIHAYTATASHHVQNDIVRELRMRDAEILVGSFDRPNLFYRAEERLNAQGRLGQILAVIRRHPGDSGIIYCITRKDVEKLCAELRQVGLSALPYHAGLDADNRRANQDAFIREEVDIIVATVAFGMGIDKSNVRYVIHAGCPKSVEHYQQEAGRAGRDGLPAECCLFYQTRDFVLWRWLINKGDEEAARDGDATLSKETKRIALRKLREMDEYCNTGGCRHASLVQYFGQRYSKINCRACDNCLPNALPPSEAIVLAQKILSCVIRLQESQGPVPVARVLCGQAALCEAEHQRLSTFGLLASYREATALKWIGQLRAQGYVQQADGDDSALRVTPAGWRVLRAQEAPVLSIEAVARKTEGASPKAEKKRKRTGGECVSIGPAQGDETLSVSVPRETSAKAALTDAPPESADLGELTDEDRALYEELRALRRQIAREKQLRPFLIFHDRTLYDLARRRPSTVESFGRVLGVGEQKCQTYGPAFLPVLRAFCETRRLPMDRWGT
ncbi:MAG TPA: RecQ family ATP-dependent DNA helicase [Candidatus Sumerlaeota bacterium]|nr:RecQ family ATP-dependent DNA helicase [Candidatus Sumerlaeota bacterium]